MIEQIIAYAGIGIAVIAVIGILKAGLRTIEPTELGAKETFGKYGSFMEWKNKVPQKDIKHGFKDSGLTFVFPFIQTLRIINTTEQIANVAKQEVITKENLNCDVDAQVYYKVKRDEESMKKALYDVSRVDYQIVQLAQSTLRAVIGQKMFKEVNSERQKLNELIFKELSAQADKWGVEVVRVELKEIFPPKDVQQTMNEIIKAENEKDKQEDLRKARVIEAEAKKQVTILEAEAKKQKDILDAEAEKVTQQTKAEGEKAKIVLQAEAENQRQVLVATGKANAIKTVAEADATAIKQIAQATADKIKLENNALTENFKGTAIVHKNLSTVEEAYKNNAKIIVTDKDNPLTFIMNDSNDKVLPLPMIKSKGKDEGIS
jgi:regulator of protease activity HflC (stomatin/prohibitin superfamily)